MAPTALLPDVTTALLEDGPNSSSDPICPLCHTTFQSSTHPGLGVRGSWRCARCGQRWDTARLAAVAAHAAWDLGRNQRRPGDRPAARTGKVEDEDLAARCDTTTLLITASTAGSVERLARRIHSASARAASPFVHASAGALPIDVVRLTEACGRLLEAAGGGSLLLADVQEMPADVQARLMTTLAGLQATRSPSTAARLMAGTTVSLCDGVAAGTFSQDLFYRLNVMHLVMREGAEDRSV